MPYKKWLEHVQQERLDSAWTNQHMYFGIRVISRAEAAHAYIEHFLLGKKKRRILVLDMASNRGCSSQQNHCNLVSNNYTVRLNAHRKLKKDFIMAVLKLLLGLHYVLFSNILNLCDYLCSLVCNSKRSIGLPCAHICDIKKTAGGVIPTDFNEHWY